MRRLRVLFPVLALAISAILFGGRKLSRHYLFPASEVSATPMPPDVETHELVARDGAKVHVVQLEGARGGRVFVIFHNNRQTIGDALGLAKALQSRGHGAMLVEYRGYGVSRGEGTASEQGLYDDAEAALDHLSTHGVPPARIVLLGTSLGSGVAAEMARRGRGGALVLVAPYTSIPDLVRDAVPIAPADLLVEDRFDTLSKTTEIRVPTLVVHGDADEIVPFWMGERLSTAIPGARLLRVPGGHHGDLFARDTTLFGEVASFPR
jgi:fermentation-respiration switch protein FrsA (DUF1100 family)